MSDSPVKRRAPFFLLTAAVVIVLDQLTKAWVKAAIPLGGSIPATGFFRLEHTQNTGASFGIFQDSARILAVFSAVGALVALWLGLYLARRVPFLQKTLNIFALGLVLGGTLGNFIDRAFIGYVTDFLKAGPWPNFNIADSATVVGGIWLAVALARYISVEESAAKPPAPQP
jgi:signal peptidase II